MNETKTEDTGAKADSQCTTENAFILCDYRVHEQTLCNAQPKESHKA